MLSSGGAPHVASNTNRLGFIVAAVAVGLLVFWFVPLTTIEVGDAARAYGDVPLALGDGRYLTPLGITLVVMPTLWAVLASPLVAGVLLNLAARQSSRGLWFAALFAFAVASGVAAAVARLLLLQ
jgi:hypothetical protein